MAKADKAAKNSALLERIKSATKLDHTTTLTDSDIFKPKTPIRTNVPAINLALSGDLMGGFNPGLLQICGPSKHFKTLFGLVLVKAFQDAKPNGITMFFDSEFGIPQAYFDSLGIDRDRVVHIPITNIEEFKFEMMTQLDGITQSDDLMVFVDSIGNLASKKEVDDALEGKSAADMTRAKQLKSVFRMITPHLTLKKIPMVVVNHTYMEQGMYPKAIVSGGTGITYSSDTIWIIGRRQSKDADGLNGFDFVINIEKSRHVIEKSQIPVSVKFDGGINIWSGLLDIAMEYGYVDKPSTGWYVRTHIKNDKKFRIDDTSSKDFWLPIFKDTDFKEVIKQKYQTAHQDLIKQDENSLELSELE